MGHESDPVVRYGFSSCLRSVCEGCTQILPIYFWSKVFWANSTGRLRRYAQTQTLSNLLPYGGRLPQIANGGTAAGREIFLLGLRQGIEVCNEIFHEVTIPRGIGKNNTLGQFTCG